MKAIIPTGGTGTRMRPLTFSSNKHFLPVANKPLIFYPIETVADAGIKEILITYSPKSLDMVKSYLGDGSQWGVNFTFVLQEEPKGLANIFQVCEEDLKGDSFLLHLGDNIFVDGIRDFVERFYRDKPEGLVPMVKHKDNRRLGVPYFDENGRLVKYVEKPENPPHDFAIPGLYFFSNSVFDCFRGEDAIKPSPRGELEISAPFQWLIDHNKRVDVLEYKGTWLDPGKFDDWLLANEYLLDRNVEPKIDSEVDAGSKIEGRAQIGKGCTILNSHIRGPVIVGDNVRLVNANIGPFTSIGDECTVEDSKIENSILMKGVKIVKVGQAIETSLIGGGTEIIKAEKPTNAMSLFIGEKCRIEV